jgi:hypothetical protein
MHYRFNASEWVDLSPGERVKRCRLMAYEASELARRSVNSATKRQYLELAEKLGEARATDRTRDAERKCPGSLVQPRPRVPRGATRRAPPGAMRSGVSPVEGLSFGGQSRRSSITAGKS